jgi:hypothetical protein
MPFSMLWQERLTFKKRWLLNRGDRVVYFPSNPSVSFLTQLHSISEYCRIVNTPHHLHLYWNWLSTLRRPPKLWGHRHLPVEPIGKSGTDWVAYQTLLFPLCTSKHSNMLPDLIWFDLLCLTNPTLNPILQDKCWGNENSYVYM